VYPPPYPRPVPLSPGGAPLADYGTRLLAYLIDTALLIAVSLVVVGPVFVWAFVHWMPSAGEAAVSESPSGAISVALWRYFLPMLLLEAGAVGLMLIAYYFYAVEYMHRTGQTLGKKAMGIRVVPLDPRLRLTRWMAVKRYAVQHLAGTLVPLFSYVDGFWPLGDKPFQQALHDKAAGTVVVKVLP
jgi:uncharacterized RDD family membrane protein YckC